MEHVTASELKTRGVSALEEALAENDGTIISVRGKPRFVVMGIEQYDRLREDQIYAAWQETKADIRAGRYVVETVDEHMARLERELAEDAEN